MKVGIFIFNDAEVLDFAGPFEVFSVTAQIHENPLFEVFLIGENLETITAVNGLSVNPKYSIYNHPPIDILIIAGGQGTRNLLQNNLVLNWVNIQHEKVNFLISICSGARLLAKLNWLDGKEFCTHHQVYENIKEIAPKSIALPNKRFIQSTEKIFTSAGISAGIDVSFHIIEKIFGSKIKQDIASYMEYDLKD